MTVPHFIIAFHDTDLLKNTGQIIFRRSLNLDWSDCFFDEIMKFGEEYQGGEMLPQSVGSGGA